MQRFKDQIENEQRLSFAVKNYARNSVEKPMEKLLLEWRWDKALASTFKLMIGKISSLTGKNFFKKINKGVYFQFGIICLIWTATRLLMFCWNAL